MKITRLISGFLAAAAAMSAMTFSAFAKSPVLLQEETVLFDQSLKGVTGASDLPNFEVSEGWQYFDYFIGKQGDYNVNEKLVSAKKYDLTDSTSWEFEMKLLSNSNGYNIFLGWDEENSKGYKLNWHNGASHQKLSLYKAGDDTPVAQSDALGDRFAATITYTIKYSDGKLSVDWLVFSGGKTSNMGTVFTYDGASASDFNGKFGIQGAAGSTLVLFNLKLTEGNGGKVDHWIYDEDFDGETLDSLKAKGWSLGGSAAIRNNETKADYLYTSGTHSFMPKGMEISGSFGLKAETRVGYNGYIEYIALRGADDMEYRIYPSFSPSGSNKATNAAGEAVSYCAIVKCNKSVNSYQGVTDEMVLVKQERKQDDNYNNTSWDIKTVVSDTSVKITAVLNIAEDETVAGELFTLTAEDITDIVIPVKAVVSGPTSDQAYLYNFSAYSIPDEVDRVGVSYDKVIIDKKFSADDSYDRLIADGFHRTAEKGVYDRRLEEYTSFVDSVGMDYDSVFYYTMPEDTTDYTLEIDGYREYGSTKIRFSGTSDGSSSDAVLSEYYELEAGQISGKYSIFLRKKTAGADAVQLAAKEDVGWANAGVVNFSNYKIKCDCKDDGSLDITAEFKGAAGETQTLTYTDSAPLTGKVLYMNVGNYGSVQRFRLTEPVTESDINGDIPVFAPKFYNASGNAITKIEAGTVYAKAFALPLDDMVVTAALYDDGHMQDIKHIAAAQLTTETGAKLFDVPETGKPQIRLFIFEDGKSLNKLTQTLELR